MSSLTLDAWLQARELDVPIELRRYLRSAIAQPLLHAPFADAVAQLPEQAATLLRRLLDGARETRDAALPLLGLDAVVSYALEASAQVVAESAVPSAVSLDETAQALMQRLAQAGEAARA